MMEFLSVLWFFLIFVLIAGYFVLDGFDLGIGVLSPFIAKNDEERAVLRRAIRPCVGRQRGVAPHGGRCAVRRLPGRLCHDVLRVLPGRHAGAVRPYRARRVLRVPCRRSVLGEALGRVLLCGLAASGAAARRGGGQHLRRHPHGRRGRLRRRASDRPHHAFHAADGAFGPGDVFGRRRLLGRAEGAAALLPSGPRRTAAPAPASDRACSVRRGVRVRPRSCRARDGSELGHPAVAVRGAGGGGAAGLARRGQDVRGRPEGVSGSVRVH